jgi:hypothetical protein
MARKGRTFEWNGNRVDEVVVELKKRQRQSARRPSPAKKETLDFQSALALFTFSSVLMVFAGLGLFAAIFVLYAVIFG